VDDNQTIVIGGLIEDTIALIDTRVPCLGDIPGLKWFFKSINRSNQKTNLFVFLSPRVVHSRNEAETVYMEKKDQIDQIREGIIKMYEKPAWDNPEDSPSE
jgi:general secretion pathway protein D